MKLRSPGATKLLGALALALLAGVGWLLLLSPQTSALAEVHAQVDTTRDQNDALRLQLIVLQQQQAQLEDTSAAAEALAAKFPPTADQPELFRAVTAAATDAGIPARSITTLTPTPPVVGSGDPAAGVQLPGAGTTADIAVQNVSLTVEGSYDEMRKLIENLEGMPRAYLINSLTLSAGTTPDTFTATIAGEMFLMPPAKDPAATKASSSVPDQSAPK